jgi:membrane protein DedA with SNARE-associated domain
LTVPGAALAATTEADLGGVAGWAISLMEALGGPGVGLAIALENLFPPIPSEVILPLAGFTASQGDLSLAGALVWTTVGSVVGALTLYGLGALLGLRRLRAIAVRMPLVEAADIDKTVAWFERHGTKAVLFGRMLPIFRSLISIPAGLDRMPLLLFTALTLAGSAIWNTVLVLAGYYLGERWEVVEDYAGILQYVVIAAVVAALAWFVVSRLRTQRARRAVQD